MLLMYSDPYARLLELVGELVFLMGPVLTKNDRKNA